MALNLILNYSRRSKVFKLPGGISILWGITINSILRSYAEQMNKLQYLRNMGVGSRGLCPSGFSYMVLIK